MQPGEIVWVDVLFKPDLTKPYPSRFADRIDSIIASFLNVESGKDTSVFLKLIGTWSKDDVKPLPRTTPFSIRPNPASGNSIIISFSGMDFSSSEPSAEGSTISIFDVLGREVYRNIIQPQTSEIAVSIKDLQNGMYYIRLSSGKPDSGRFNNVVLQKSTCSIFVFKNTAKIIPTDPKSYPFKVNSAALALNNPTFQITSIVPQLPLTLYAGDSIVITACFTSIDTTTQIDTILLNAGCFVNPIDLKGNGAIPQIWASNHDFSTVIVDSTKCDTVGVYNRGKLPFTLTKDWVLDNMGVNFTFNNVGSSTPYKSLGSDDLPIVLNPGTKVLLNFCYTPHAEEIDTTIMHWGTTLQDPCKSSIKDSSILYGSGVKTGFVWDRTVQPMQVASQKIDSEIIRVWLLDNGGRLSPPAHINSVYFSGTDTSDFHIMGNQLGFSPVQNFNLNPNDSVWVDVMFRPDLTKPYSIRQADLVASGNVEKDKVIHFTGTILAKNDVKTPMQILSFTIRPNPASGNSVIVSFPEQITNGTITIFDVLGREVYFTPIPQGASQVHIPLGNIPNGIYYIRLQSENTTVTQKLEVLK